MRKTIYYSMIILAGLCFAACSKDKPVVTNNQEEESVGITLPETISVAIPDNLTRVSLTQDDDADGAVKLAWDEDDKIYVADSDHNETWTTYEIDTPLGENPHVATFHRVGDEITASSFDIFYGAPSLAIAEGIDFSEQIQEGNANTDHLQYMALISGVNTVENVQFTSDWAAENGGSFKQSGIIRLRLQMPSGVTAVSSVFLEASSAVFSTTNKLDRKTDMIKVDFSSDVDISSDHIVTVYANLPWENVSLSAGVGLTVVVKTSDGYYYSKEISNASGLAFSTGSVNAIKLSRSGFGVFAGGTGVDGDPYTIATKWHLMNTKPCTDAANDGSVTCFKLLNDIDMSGLTWDMLNPKTPYDKLIDFDGNNKTISNLGKSLFYVLKGSVSDLTLDGCQVSTRGILSEYIQGTGNVVSNVTVSNGIVNTSSNNAGALIGTINNGSGTTCATISDCTVSNTDVTGVGVVGGLIGFADALVSVSGCTFTGGTVSATARYAGGMIASTSNYSSVISDCHVKNAIVTSSADRCGGFAGLLHTSVQVKGCTVGTSTDPVIFNSTQTTATANAGGFAGCNYGKITKNGDVRSKAYVTVKSSNVTTSNSMNIGGFVGYNTGTIEYCDAVVTMTELKGQYIGGFCGIILQSGVISNSTETGAVKGNNYTGGFVGAIDSATTEIRDCTSAGTVSAASSIGGFAGGCTAASKKGSFINNSSSASVSSSGSNVGGFIGNGVGVFTSNHATGDVESTGGGNCGGFAGGIWQESTGSSFSKNYATGSVSGNANIGGLIGYIGGNLTMSDCFATGNVGNSNRYNQKYGGLVGFTTDNAEYSTDITITNCYATGNVEASFASAGLIGRIGLSSCTVSSCVAWNARVYPHTIGSENWSSAAVVGVAFPTCTLTNNYRNPSMNLTAYWVPEDMATFQHADVSSEHPLTDSTGAEMGDTATAKGQPHYPQYPYHGKVEAGKTLSRLASTTLGWSSDVWDFTGDLPTLK